MAASDGVRASIDPGVGEVGQVVAAAVDLELEVAGPAADPQRELRRDAPAEVLEGVARRIPGREHGRTQALDVAVLVAGDRADVVGGDDPAPVVVDARRTRTTPRRDSSSSASRTGGRRSVSKTSRGESAWIVAARP